MFFQLPFLERFLLLSPLYLLQMGILLSVLFISIDFKNRYLWIFDAVLIGLFFIFVFIFFYINKIDFIAGFPLKKIYVFLIILFLNLIILEKPNEQYNIMVNFIFLLCAISIIFFEKLFIIFSGLIIVNLLLFYSGLKEETDIAKQIFYILIAILLLGFCFNLSENSQLNKFCLTGLVALIFGFSVFNAEVLERLKVNHQLFLSIIILYFIALYKILIMYGKFFTWQPIFFILIILFLSNSFYFLTEEKYKKFLFYDFISNAYFLYLFLITAEFKFRCFIISLIFFLFLILTSSKFIKNNDNDKLSVTFVKYNIHKIKENINVFFNLFLSLIFNIYIIFELVFSIYDIKFIKMIIFFVLIVFFIIFLNKTFIFFSMAKNIIRQKLLLKNFYENFILIFLTLIFYSILIFNLKNLNLE